MNRNLVLATVCGAAVLVNIDLSAVNVALASIQADLSLSVGDMAWVLNSYTLAFACLIAVAGRIGDLHGRRFAFIAGTVLFVGASLANGLAQSDWWLISGRAVQGAGAALMFPAMLAIASVTFPGKERAVAIGTVITTAGVCQATGPLLGGALAEFLGWRWIFFVNIPVGTLVIIVALRVLPESRDENTEKHIDWLGASALVLSLAGLTIGIDQAGTWGWTSPYTLGLTGFGAVMLFLFVTSEFRRSHPLIDPQVLTNRNFQAANAAGGLLYFVYFPLIMYLALLMQKVMAHTAFQAGLGLLPLIALIALLARPTARLAATTGAPPLMSGGFALTAVGAAALAWIVDVDSSYQTLVVPLIAIGLGMGLVLALNASTAVGSIAPAQAGLASGVNFTVRLMGAVLGLAIITTLFKDLDGGADARPEDFVAAFKTTLYILAGAAVLGGLINHTLVSDPEKTII